MANHIKLHKGNYHSKGNRSIDIDSTVHDISQNKIMIIDKDQIKNDNDDVPEDTQNFQFDNKTENGLNEDEKNYDIEVELTNIENSKVVIELCENIQYTKKEEGVFDTSHFKLDINSKLKMTSNLDKIHQKIIKLFPTVNLFKDVTNDSFMEISQEEIYTRFTFIGIVVTSIMCLLPLWPMIEITIRTKSARVVKPIVPKQDNPYGNFLSADSNLLAFLI